MQPLAESIEVTPFPSGDNRSSLRLRHIHENDMPTLSRIFTDSEIVKWTLVPSPWSDAHHRDYLDRVAQTWQSGGARWVIVDADNKVCGTVGLNRSDARTASLVFQVAPWARERKVALRACHAAAKFAFEDLGIQRLTFEAKVGNHVSRLIAQRLGFRFEGVARAAAMQRQTPIDLWRAAMLPGELRELDDPPDGYALSRQRAEVLTQPQPRLITSLADLTIRPLRSDDVDLLVEACRDPENLRWTTIPLNYDKSMAEGFVAEGANMWRDGSCALFALADGNDQFCGTIDLRLAGPDPLIGEVGFSTAPWARGKGYMTAAVQALCNFGFESFGLKRITWQALVGNDASRRVAEKAGFTSEGIVYSGTVHRGAERKDCWIASLVRQDSQ